MLENTIPTYLKYDGRLSVADAISVEIIHRRGINKIVSFDEDFDGEAFPEFTENSLDTGRD